MGNTPLIRLNKASEATGCEIYGKVRNFTTHIPYSDILTLLFKFQAEFLNPGGSVKDRAALYIIKVWRTRSKIAVLCAVALSVPRLSNLKSRFRCVQDAEEKGLLKEGGVIVEGTAGNTGIGLALVGNAKGYKSVIVIPETQSQVRPS